MLICWTFQSVVFLELDLVAFQYTTLAIVSVNFIGSQRCCCGWKLGSFSKVVVTFNHVGGSFNLSVPPPGCLNNSIFLNLGLCAACWAHFICHHELWTTSVSHPFSSLDSILGLAGGKHYQKITMLSLDFFKILLFQAAFHIFYCYLFSLLPSVWFVIAVCGSISVRELVKY